MLSCSILVEENEKKRNRKQQIGWFIWIWNLVHSYVHGVCMRWLIFSSLLVSVLLAVIYFHFMSSRWDVVVVAALVIYVVGLSHHGMAHNNWKIVSRLYACIHRHRHTHTYHETTHTRALHTTHYTLMPKWNVGHRCASSSRSHTHIRTAHVALLFSLFLSKQNLWQQCQVSLSPPPLIHVPVSEPSHSIRCCIQMSKLCFIPCNHCTASHRTFITMFYN